MAVETRGTVHMRGESGPGVSVEVFAAEARLSLLSGMEVIGAWDVDSIGIQSLNEGFAIRAEGEEFVLKTEDDVGLAMEIGMSAASPRLARKVAASQNPEERAPEPAPKEAKSSIGAIGFALGGVLVLSGGFFLRDDPTLSAAGRTASEGLQAAGRFWFAFVVGGLLMVGVSFVLALRARWARIAAVLAVVGMVIVFGVAAQNATPDADHLLAYGFIAGGIVVGIGVIFGGSLDDGD